MVVSYRCRPCGAVFNRVTGTLFSGTPYSCCTLVLFLRGVGPGATPPLLAEELGWDPGTLRTWRHRRQAPALAARVADPLPDGGVEADELFQNAGEKGTRHPAPADPPRRRANKRRGRGTAANDRPPVVGVVGRESGQIRLPVGDDTQQTTVAPAVAAATGATSTVYSDDATSFAQIGQSGHLTVQHGAKEWARAPMGMGCGKSMTTPWKESGRDGATFCGLAGGA